MFFIYEILTTKEHATAKSKGDLIDMFYKSYAIIAAASLRNSHHRNDSARVEPAKENAAVTQKLVKSFIASSRLTTNTSAIGMTSIPTANVDSASQNVQNRTENPITIDYNTGAGKFHQKNTRASSGGIAAFDNGNGNNSGSTYPNAINGNANLLLGGAMLSLVTTILCIVCYCCHRNIKKRTEAAYRLHRQWLENDSNMEIYSVEQCYETTGLFLDESADGLAVISMLHREPPPSYDAVVATLDQEFLQQQQVVQQPSSPPPGYRSSLDVSCAGALSTVCTLDSADSMGTRESRDHVTNQPNEMDINRNDTRGNAFLSMKKVLSAQSCCSLQRAEAENMWNAATADAALRATHGRPPVGVNADEHTAANTEARETAVSARKLTVNNIGCQFLNKNCYRPDVGDMLSLSVASELNNLSTAMHQRQDDCDVTNNNYSLQNKPETVVIAHHKNAASVSCPHQDGACSCFSHRRKFGTDTHHNAIAANTSEQRNTKDALNGNLHVTSSTNTLNGKRELPHLENTVDPNAIEIDSIVRSELETAIDITLGQVPNSDAINGNDIVRLDMDGISDNTRPAYI